MAAKVTKVSLFQVAEVPTNMYDYTLPTYAEYWYEWFYIFINEETINRHRAAASSEEVMLCYHEIVFFGGPL